MGNTGSKRKSKVAADNQHNPAISRGVVTQPDAVDSREDVPTNRESGSSQKPPRGEDITQQRLAAHVKQTPPHQAKRAVHPQPAHSLRRDPSSSTAAIVQASKRQKTEGDGLSLSDRDSTAVRGAQSYTVVGNDGHGGTRTTSSMYSCKEDPCLALSNSQPDLAAATDGYISFSESSESDLEPRGAPVARHLEGARSSDAAAEDTVARASQDQARGRNPAEGGGAGGDMWDWSEDDSENAGHESRSKRGSWSAEGGASTITGIQSISAATGTAVCGGVGVWTVPPTDPPVAIDRFGRRANAARRPSSSSSSSSSDNFEGWDEETEEDEGGYDDDANTGGVYDWTAMDTTEGDALHPVEECGGKRRKSSGHVSTQENSSGSSRTRAEANPLASKLGLSSSAPRARPIIQLPGQGRGPGPGLEQKPMVPGRPGRPRYSPLAQGRPHFPGPQTRPPQGFVAIRSAGPIARIGDAIRSEVGGSGGTVFTAMSKASPVALRLTSAPALTGGVEKGTGVAGYCETAGIGPPFSSAATTTGNMAAAPKGNTAVGHTVAISALPSTGPSTSPVAIAQRIQSPIQVAHASEGMRPPGGSLSAQGPAQTAGPEQGVIPVPTCAIDGRMSVTRSRSVTSAPRGSSVGGTEDHTAGLIAEPAREYRSQSTAGRGSGGMGPPRGIVARPRPTSTPAPSAALIHKEEVAVKDTANITRKKAQLPQQEQLEHPTPVGGNWLKNRYIVNNYILLEPLGTGSYAEVRLAKEKTSNKLYAVKIMNKDFLKKKQVGKEGTFMDDIKREIAIMKKVHHPNVLRLYEVMDDPKVNKLYLVLEYCKKGDLMHILNGDARAVTCDPMNDADVWYIMRQIVQGLSFLHLQNIVHGDIKPQNLLVGADNVAKIADFGISKFVQGEAQRLQEQAGTPTFMSPELCSGGAYSGQLADVWALGATMYMIRCGKPPFVANQMMALYEKIQNHPLEFPIEVNMSAGLRRLLRAMMEKNSAKRITLDQVVSDCWLQQGDYGFYAGAATPSSPGPPVGSAGHATGTSSHPASGAGGHTTSPPGLGFGQRPPPPILPLRQQGYQAIRVSEDEVDQSISGGSTSQQPGGATEAVDGRAVARGARVRAGGPSGAPPQQRLTPPIEEKAAAEKATGAAIGEELGRSDTRGVRGHLSETEESWKFQSFKKKMENLEVPKFRGVCVAGENVDDQALAPIGDATPPATTLAASRVYALSAAKPAMASADLEKDETDEFSDDEADTLFETESDIASSATSRLGEREIAAGPSVGIAAGGVGDHVSDWKGVRGGRRRVSRRSSEKFDAVMDTLAAQPRSNRGDRDSGQRRSSGDGRTRTTQPLRDVSLRGVSVVSSSPGESSNRLRLLAVVSQQQGKRPSQEDRTMAATEFASVLAGKVERPYLFQPFAIFGVFDGHNGQLCSEALSVGLHLAIARQPVFHQSPEKAIVQAFESFDRELCARQEQEGDASGSTALAVLFDSREGRLLVANVGDSRCVASKSGVAARLSDDHRLSRPYERERVAASGGFVTNNRINGVLAISRSFGDVQHKERKSPGLIATPEVVSESVDPGLEFLLLATDGLWDVIDDQEAVNFVRLRLSENPDLASAAKQLTKHALDEGSVDNVSVVLVWFQNSKSSPEVPSAEVPPSNLEKCESLRHE